MSAVFAGMHKFTLLDFPDKTACTLFTQGCNFACPYCQNPSLIAFAGGLRDNRGGGEDAETPGLPLHEILDFLNSRRQLLDGVCISGGEPTAHEGLADFTRTVKELGFLVKIDTNGSYPDRLKELVEAACVDYVAMDIKNSLEKYPATVGREGYDTAPVEESIGYLLGGRIPHEFRTTVVREFHGIDDLLSIARIISGADNYFIQGFDNPETALTGGLSAYSGQEMRDMCERVKKELPRTSLRGV